jgi:hypothetical protein
MPKWKPMSDGEFERQLELADQAGALAKANEPRAISARYDQAARRLVIDLNRGVTLLIDPDLVSELRGASLEEIAEIELLPSGNGLHWERLDLDISVPGLLVDLMGTKPLLAEVGKRARGITSEAKAIASRENGKKGGRPKRSAMP